MSHNKIAVAVASVLTIVWVCVFGYVNFMGDPSTPAFLSPGTLTLIIQLVVPAALIWLAAASVSTSLQTDNRLWRLESDLRNIRNQLSSDRKLRDQGNQPEWFGDPVSTLQANAEASVHQPEERQTVEDDGDPQPDADAPTEDAPQEQEEEVVSNSLLIRALNFAEDEKDVMGIAAVETAARIPEVADLLTSSMKVLEFFAESGITVDHMGTRLSNPDDWRNAAVSGSDLPFTDLSEILDPWFTSAVQRAHKEIPELADASRDLRERAAALLGTFARDAEDDEIVGLLNTRTYRSVILLEHADA